MRTILSILILCFCLSSWGQIHSGWDGNTAGQCKWSMYVRRDGTGSYYWELTGEKQQPASVQWESLVHKYNSIASFPVGQWVEMEIYVLRGVSPNGRFYVAITPDGGAKQVVFDEQCTTMYPGGVALPVNWYQPWKFYMYSTMVDYVRSRGGSMDIYYDNFRWYNH